MGMYEEIFEQPLVLERLLSEERDKIQQAANAIAKQKNHFAMWQPGHFVMPAVRGVHLGSFIRLQWGGHTSLFSFYQTPPDLKKSFVAGISQSGQSPDIVSVLAEAQRQGVLTLAITNSPDSPLAESADWVIDIKAGVEKAVAATKTYTAELMAVAMLSAALDADHPERWEELARVPNWMRTVLQLDSILAGRPSALPTAGVCGARPGINYAALRMVAKAQRADVCGAMP